MYVPSYSKRVLVLVNSVRLRYARDRLRRDITCIRRRHRRRRNGGRGREWEEWTPYSSGQVSTSNRNGVSRIFLVEIKTTKRYLFYLIRVSK